MPWLQLWTCLLVLVSMGEAKLVCKIMPGRGHCAASPDVSKIEIDLQLWEACQRGEAQEADRLVREGAEVNVAYMNRDGLAKTALHLAVIAGSLETVRVLCQHGADLDQVDNFGCTALHMAAAMGNLEMTKMLLLMGCSWNMGNIAMQYPRTVARLNNHVEVAEFLEQEELLQQIYGDEIDIEWTKPLGEEEEEEDYNGRGSQIGNRVLSTSSAFWRNLHKDKRFFPSRRSEEKFFRDVREAGRLEKERVKRMLQEKAQTDI
eukprot:761161-Hanusia_phi.AAC.3